MPSADVLKIIADNPVLLDELRAVLLKHFSVDRVDTTLPNDRIGEVVRARIDGQSLIEAALKEIERCKTVKPSPSVPNPAR